MLTARVQYILILLESIGRVILIGGNPPTNQNSSDKWQSVEFQPKPQTVLRVAHFVSGLEDEVIARSLTRLCQRPSDRLFDQGIVAILAHSLLFRREEGRASQFKQDAFQVIITKLTLVWYGGEP